MRSIGSFLLMIGVLAIILDFANMVPKVLFWIYMCGDGVAWAIKIALIILGAVLFFIGKEKPESDEKPAE